MAHQLGAPLPGMQHYHHDIDDVEDLTDEGRMSSVSRPRIHPWCSVVNCTERPLRQYTASNKQIVFMCRSHFSTVPSHTRDGWKQYRGTRTFPESKIVIACRPGPNRGNGATGIEEDPGYTNHPDDDKANRGQLKNAMWPGKIYNVLYQVWNAHAEQKKINTGDSYMSALDRAELVPEAANVLREQGQLEMADILDNTTEGSRKAIHSRMLTKYIKTREAFMTKLRGMSIDPQEVADWDDALIAAQHHVDMMPAMVSRERNPHPHTGGHEDHADGGGGASAGGAMPVPDGGGGAVGDEQPGDGSMRPLYNGAAMTPRKKPGRKPKMEGGLQSPEAKRARALDSMVSAAERSNALQKGAAAAGAEHLRRLELADAERLNMEREEHALRMAIGKSALALLNKMAGEPPLPEGPQHAAGPMS